MANIYDLAAKFRQEVADRQAEPLGRMLSSYAQLYKQLEPQILSLTQEVAAARERGEAPLAKLYQLERASNLRDELATQINKIARDTDLATQDQQRWAINAAQRHQAALIAEGLDTTAPGISGGFTTPNLAPLQAQVGFLADGSPLSSLLGELPAEGAQAAMEALALGVGTGMNPKQVARLFQASLGGNAARARTIARTEMLRAYRQSSQLAMDENSDVVKGWVWHSALGSASCAVCWAMNGQVFPTDEMMGTHPNCRCQMVPKTRTWDEMGISGLDENQVEIEPGPDQFDALPPATQRVILGPGKFKAYSEGQFKLKDLVVKEEHPKWGTIRYEKPLKDLNLKPVEPSAPKVSARRAYSEAQDAKRAAAVPEVPVRKDWKQTTPTFWGGLSKTSVDRVTAGIDIAVKRFPVLGERLDFVGTYAGWNAEAPKVLKRRAPKPGVMAETIRHGSVGDKVRILFVNKYLSNLKDLRQTMVLNHAAGHFSTSHDHHVAVHEMGHVASHVLADKFHAGNPGHASKNIVHNQMDEALRKHFAPELSNYDWALSAKKAEVMRSVSKYANASSEEFLAEVFAQYLLDPGTKNETVQVVGRWMSKELEGL